MKRQGFDPKAFTLIELLIVVAIIAILAAIAVPNFLEAQVRSKVSRVVSDMRSLRTGLEAYRIDANKYPETDFGPFRNPSGKGLQRLTTPISYMTSVPTSPFDETKVGQPQTAGQEKFSFLFNHVLYVRAIGVPGITTAPSIAGYGEYDNDYALDRVTYLRGAGSLTPGNIQFATQGYYGMKSVGPDNVDNRRSDIGQFIAGASFQDARIYDPTNGTASAGDIVNWQDTSIQASQRQ
ncbi:MAG: prepilin-type N-terminal cleavage/methylation domain-containing protein [Candidatus Sumerlaeia bacterium]|nr:prepilin-type N-terminal cleavage/methylation domain-containing protein [Candidatus Sumerlaeia bacterium]